jgi:hypothetical protein
VGGAVPVFDRGGGRRAPNGRGDRATRLAQERLILVRGEQLIALGGIRELHLDHPPVAIGRIVHERGFLVELVVDRGDRARHRRVKLRDGLHGFDGAEDVVLLERRADLGQLDENDVTELALGVIGDADVDGVTGPFDVFVVFGVEQVLRNVGHLRF